MTSKIYLFCVEGGMRKGDVIGYALAEDGVCLAQHLSSDKYWSQHDMGLTSDWKHDNYSKHYPDGFELEWIEEKDLDNHVGYNDAFELNKKMAAKEKEEKK